ncbi:MAG: AbrB/MazE/SpoVT family DNA-binding domain-containing protein [Acidobacteria bacterium]|nr:AbrB/MazE/SpoVT family DNA-binding domain-containing protein [Acidobacteriota bacterium]
MNVEAKITSKGQITIPLEVRKKLGLRPGDKIVFEEIGDEHGMTVRPVKGESPFAKYRGIERSGGGRSLDEIVAEVRAMRDGVID